MLPLELYGKVSALRERIAPLRELDPHWWGRTDARLDRLGKHADTIEDMWTVHALEEIERETQERETRREESQ